MKKLLSLFAILGLTSMACFAVANNEQQNRENLMLNLKSCTPYEAQLSDGQYQVLGYANGACAYKVVDKEQKTEMECKFPTPVAQRYGYEAIKATKEGVESSFVKSMNNSSYCVKK